MVKKFYMIRRTFVLFLSIVVSGSLPAQPIPDNWHLLDPTGDYPGIGVEKVYQQFGSPEASTKTVVAVIDSGVDTDHEDLDDVLWVNTREIPENGIDDDNNGYVDDIHGWNFIGSQDGKNIIKETFEVTRLYAKFRDRFEGVDPESLSRKEKKQYALYQEAKETVETERRKAEKSLAKLNETEALLMDAMHELENVVGVQEITTSTLKEIDEGDNRNLMIAKKVLGDVLTQTDEESITIAEIREQIESEFDAVTEQYQSNLEYHYNPDFNSREIIGDNYVDQREQYYGNNMVSGDFAFHGTHVSGIIAAERNNDIGVDGIAANARIMVLRVVPDGDEHDKDVANAIRYAVDNGAKVINMSFGKGYPWDKQVVDDAVRYAAKHDVLLVHAAGNDANLNTGTNNYPNDIFAKRKFLGPKYARNWIEVGALSYQKGENMIAGFSNYGKEQVDLFAPGVYIYSTTPGNNYQHSQGTSFASPIVAGVAALIRSRFPELTAEQVKDILMESVTPISEKVLRPGTYDRVPASELSQSGGIVNAYEAYKLAAKTKGKNKKSSRNDSKRPAGA